MGFLVICQVKKILQGLGIIWVRQWQWFPYTVDLLVASLIKIKNLRGVQGWLRTSSGVQWTQEIHACHLSSGAGGGCEVGGRSVQMGKFCLSRC